MYKVQRIAGTGYKGNGFVTVDTYGVAADMAREDARINNSVLTISEERGGKWYKIELYSKNYEIHQTANGFEIRTRTGNKWQYLTSVYNGECKWNRDYTYSKKYKTFKAAEDIVKELIKA